MEGVSYRYEYSKQGYTRRLAYIYDEDTDVTFYPIGGSMLRLPIVARVLDSERRTIDINCKPRCEGWKLIS